MMIWPLDKLFGLHFILKVYWIVFSQRPDHHMMIWKSWKQPSTSLKYCNLNFQYWNGSWWSLSARVKIPARAANTQFFTHTQMYFLGYFAVCVTVYVAVHVAVRMYVAVCVAVCVTHTQMYFPEYVVLCVTQCMLQCMLQCVCMLHYVLQCVSHTLSCTFWSMLQCVAVCSSVSYSVL